MFARAMKNIVRFSRNSLVIQLFLMTGTVLRTMVAKTPNKEVRVLKIQKVQ